MRTHPMNVVYQREISDKQGIQCDYVNIAVLIEAKAGKAKPLVVGIDGMWGVDFRALVDKIRTHLPADFTVKTILTTAALHSPIVLKDTFSTYLTDNPVFGNLCGLDLKSYFEPTKLANLEGQISIVKTQSTYDVLFVLGPGALLYCTSLDLSFYWDMTREAMVARHREGCSNLGFANEEQSAGAKYKIAYYVEWPLLEKHKYQALPQVDYYVDASRNEPRFVSLPLLMELISAVSTRPFRCKPYFQPGVWGGQRLKEVANLPSHENLAWDFELVAPENSILLGLEEREEYLEIPFSMMMWKQSEAILGQQGHYDFDTFFPIRVNYLDTIGGSNLSCQVHPHHAYIRGNFGEPIAQHESYYIVESKPGARVYLGFKEETVPDDFREAIRAAEEDQIPFEIDTYINDFPANEGDYFIIPSGTVHCSGADNLVLEISATPYLYAFKLYDYLRPDLNGQPRPINSKFGLDVLDWTMKTQGIQRHLIPQPLRIREEVGGSEELLGTSHLYFFGVTRIKVQSSLLVDPGASVELLVLVKGPHAKIRLKGDPRSERDIAYLESMIIPAAAGMYEIINDHGEDCEIMRIFLKQ